MQTTCRPLCCWPLNLNFTKLLSNLINLNFINRDSTCDGAFWMEREEAQPLNLRLHLTHSCWLNHGCTNGAFARSTTFVITGAAATVVSWRLGGCSLRRFQINRLNTALTDVGIEIHVDAGMVGSIVDCGTHASHPWLLGCVKFLTIASVSVSIMSCKYRRCQFT